MNILYCQTALAVVIILIFGLPFVGIQAFLPVMYRAGVYEELCNHGNGTMARDYDNSGLTVTAKCEEQRLRLSLMFTIAVSVLNFSILPVSVFMHPDYLGFKRMFGIGVGINTLSVVIFALSTAAVPLWLPAYALWGISGAAMSFPIFAFVPFSLLPEHAALLNALLMGCLDASSVVMTIFKYLDETYPNLTMRWILLAYSALSFCCFGVVHFLFRPRTSDANTPEPPPDRPVVRTPPGLEGVAARTKHLCNTRHFVLTALWVASLMTSKYFYVGNVDNIVAWQLGKGTPSQVHLLDTFNIVLFASGGFGLISTAVERRLGVPGMLAFMGASVIVVAVGSTFPYEVLAYAGVIALVCARFLLFSIAPLVLVSLFGRDLGPTTLFGCALFLGALVNLTGYFWTWLSVHPLKGDFRPAMILLNASSATICFLLAWKLWVWTSVDQASSHNDINGERDPLVTRNQDGLSDV